jgi:hypothetical protein
MKKKHKKTVGKENKDIKKAQENIQQLREKE